MWLGCRYGWVLGDEPLDFCWLGRVGRAGRDGEEEVPQIGGRGDREDLEGVRHHVGIAPVREMELNRHPVWIGIGRAVRNGRKTPIVGEAHRHGDRAAVEERRPAERLRFRRSSEASLDDNALGVNSSESSLLPKYLVHGVYNFGLHPRIIRQGEVRRSDGDKG